MSWNQVEGYWIQLLGRTRERWGELTHRPFDVLQGKRTQMVGRLQRMYGDGELTTEQVTQLRPSSSESS